MTKKTLIPLENSPFDVRIRFILAKTEIHVGILVDKNLKKNGEYILTNLLSKRYVFNSIRSKLIHNSNTQVSILDVTGVVKKNAEIRELIRAIEHKAPNHIQLINESSIEKNPFENIDLVLISISSWKQLTEEENNWLNNKLSMLIMKA